MKMCDKFENKLFLPFVIVSAFVILIVLSLVNAYIPEGFRIILVSLLIWTVWFVLFLRENIRGSILFKRKSEGFIKLLFAVCISIFFVKSIWFSGYLTLNPWGLVEGKTHIDTLFHATIAESIKNYGYPSLLLDNIDFLHYHFGSHTVIAVLSLILNISILNVYNYLYPIICIPVYVFLVVSVIVEVRKYKDEVMRLAVIDYFFLASFFLGFMPKFFLDRIGIWKSSWVSSESYLFALIFFLLYVLLVFRIVKRGTQVNLFLCILTPFFIVICSSMKISVGFLLTAGIMYINFRNNMKRLQYWGYNILILIVFLVSYKIFSEVLGHTEFQIFAFVRSFFSTKLFLIRACLHYCYLLLFTLCVVSYQFFNHKSLKKIFISNKLILEESLLVVSLCSILPGLVLDIPGGSASYFSYFQELIAISMFLGFNIPAKIQKNIQEKNAFLNNAIKYCIIFIVLIMCINIKDVGTFIQSTRQGKYTTTYSKSLLTNINEINVVAKEKISYGIFLDDTSEIFEIYKKDKRRTIFFYPALIGIRILNGVYTDETSVFAADGTYLSDITEREYYNTNLTADIKKLTLNEARKNAKEKGLKYIIYFYKDKYQIIDL